MSAPQDLSDEHLTELQSIAQSNRRRTVVGVLRETLSALVEELLRRRAESAAQTERAPVLHQARCNFLKSDTLSCTCVRAKPSADEVTKVALALIAEYHASDQRSFRAYDLAHAAIAAMREAPAQADAPTSEAQREKENGYE